MTTKPDRLPQIPELIEELYGMLNDPQVGAVCSIETWECDGFGRQRIQTVQSMCLEDAIPYLFKADIDQFVITDLSTEWFSFNSMPHEVRSCFIRVQLRRCI